MKESSRREGSENGSAEIGEPRPRSHGPMGGFEGGEGRWVDRLGSLRTVIRQEVISRQLAGVVRPGMSVLDVGCGQGTQAMKLASAGCRVTGLDPSGDLLQLLAVNSSSVGIAVELVMGRIEDLDDLLGGRQFSLVCCHGLFMYLDDQVSALAALAARMHPTGKLSVTFRNGHALAMRPGLRRDWPGALAAFDSGEYINELGLRARAHRIEDIEESLAPLGMRVVAWYGVRVFNDAVPGDTPVPGRAELMALLDAEERAGAVIPTGGWPHNFT